MEKEYEETERRLQQLSDELVALNCEMMVHLQVNNFIIFFYYKASLTFVI